MGYYEQVGADNTAYRARKLIRRSKWARFVRKYQPLVSIFVSMGVSAVFVLVVIGLAIVVLS